MAKPITQPIPRYPQSTAPAQSTVRPQPAAFRHTLFKLLAGLVWMR